MQEIKSKKDLQKNILLIIGFILFAFLIYELFVYKSALLDVLVAIAFYIVIFVINQKYSLSVTSIILLGITLLLNPLGVFKFYSVFVFGFLGYDKIIHFISCFAIAYALLDFYRGRKNVLTYLVVILIVLGLGAVIEIVEFLGYRYMGVDNTGMFTIEDGLPEIRSDLQTYDIYFDMIFNLLGAIFALIIFFLKTKLRDKRSLKKV